MDPPASDDFIAVTQVPGSGSETFVISSQATTLKLGLFKVNSTYYVNINGEHIVAYNHFTKLNKVSKSQHDLVLSNENIGKIVVRNCDLDVFERGLKFLNNLMKSKGTRWADLVSFFFK